jgi:hypothetical protein
MKGKALGRAMETKDVIRISGDVPLITDVTELVTPELAEKILKRNKNNRPINWRKVEEYARLMTEGKWKLHSQGIVIDADGNLLTGQKRLWAIIYSGTSVLMRISRGCPSNTASLLIAVRHNLHGILQQEQLRENTHRSNHLLDG